MAALSPEGGLSLPQKAVPSFFSLPREIRDMIYLFLLGGKEEYFQPKRNIERLNPQQLRLRRAHWRICDRFDIALTSHAAYEEASEVFYRNNTFQFHLMSKIWLPPLISQNNANIMQNVQIVFGSDETAKLGAVQFLKMFTSSQAVRNECRIELDLDDPNDIGMMRSVFRAIAALTAFQLVTVDMIGGSIKRWHTPEYAEARSVWGRLRKRLESKIGKASYLRGSTFRCMVFKPREFLMRKGSSH